MAAAVAVKDAEEMVLAGGGGAAVQEVQPDGHGVLHLAPEAADGGDAVPRPPPRPEPRRREPPARAPGRRARHPPPLAAAAILARGRRGAARPGPAQLHPGPATSERRDGRRRRRLGLVAANLGHGVAREDGVGGDGDRLPSPAYARYGRTRARRAEAQCHRTDAR
jgi:hypothetical protein